MGYRIGYNGPQVDDLLQKGYKYSVINNGWTKLESSDLAATNLDILVTPGNYSTSFWQNGPIQLVTNGPINVCVTKDSSSNTLYQTIYDAGKIYIRSTTSTSFSNTWREEQNNSTLDIGASTPVNPSDNYIWIDTSGDAPVIKIYKENKGEWVAISAADLAKKSVYDKNNAGKPFTTYLDEKIAEGDLATAEDAYKKHIVEGEDTGNPIHVTSEEKLKWNAGISTSEADTLINKFKKDMQSYADEKVNTSSTKINEITTEVNAQKKIMDNHMGDNTIHLTADQVTAFDNKAAGDHTHLNDGTVTVSTTNLTGLIPIERLDPSVLERNYTVSSYDDLFNLTKNEVQNGDSVYVSGKPVSTELSFSVSSLNNLPSGTASDPIQWCCICYGNGIYVIGGYQPVDGDSPYPVLYNSTDLVNWTYCGDSGIGSFTSICYGNGKFIATADTSGCMYSNDGITWENSNLNTYYYVCYGNGKFVAINGAKSAYSTDGINWTESSFIINNPKCICYGNGVYIALHSNSHNAYYSTDGVSWIDVDIPNTGEMPNDLYWIACCYGNDKFIAIAMNSKIYAYSTDGITWTEGTLPSSKTYKTVSFINGCFIITYEGNAFLYSTDGINWNSSNMPSDNWNYACSGNNCVICFSDTYAVTKITINAPKSTAPSAWFVVDDSKLGEYELESWTKGTMPSSQKWYSVCYGNGKFVSVSWSSNIYAYSIDGITWTEGTMPSSRSSQMWDSVCYGNDKFVAVEYNYGIFAYSTDGINWTEGTMPSSNHWHSVCYGNGKFVAVSNSSTFVYSTDGITWTKGTMPSSQKWYSVCYGNGKFVAVAYSNNTIAAYSTDGINWTQATMPISKSWQSVCYGNGKFVAVTIYTNVFVYSTDGITWTKGTMPSSQEWHSVCYGNGKFVAVSTSSNIFAYSTDGITWTQGTMPSSQEWYSVCYGNDKFVAVSRNSNVFAYSSLNKLPTALVQYAAPTPELTWNNITNKPTTISEYGLSNTYYTADEINALYNQYKTQYDEINKSVSDITNSLLEIPEDLSTTYDTNLARASELNKKLDDLLHSLGLNDKMISDIVNMYKERSIIYKKKWGYEFSKMTVGSTFMLGKYQVENETPWPIEWEIVHQTADYQIARTKYIIDFRAFDAKEPTNTDSNRKNYGNNNWQYSNIKQFLNSDQASWYSAQHQYDAAPTVDNVRYFSSNGTTYNAYDTHKGFLYYWSDNEKSILDDMTLTLANNTVTDGGGSYTWTGKVWLPTFSQIMRIANNSIYEGDVFSKFMTVAGRKISIHKKCLENNEYCKINNYTTDTNCNYLMSSAKTDNSYTSYVINAVGSGITDYSVNKSCFGITPCICLPRQDVFFEINPEEYSVNIQYAYVNESGKELPKKVVQNKPADTAVTLNYMYPEKSSQEVTIDDTHYPAGETIDADDGSGYYTFEGWTSDDSKIDSES